jgi:hypothetical protein
MGVHGGPYAILYISCKQKNDEKRHLNGGHLENQNGCMNYLSHSM